MPSDQDFNKYLGKFLHKKKWTDISGKWLGYVQALDLSDYQNSDSLSESLDISNVPANLQDTASGELKIIESDFVRTFVLGEAIFCLKKAANIISGAENGIKRGYKTWSIVNAYHGAYFAAKSILAFHGITTASIKIDSKQTLILLDCWPRLIQPPSERKKLGVLSEGEILYSKSILTKFSQRHYWMTLKRLFNVATFSNDYSSNTIKVIKNTEYKSFGRQRNDLFYGTNTWFFNDLDAFEVDDSFGIVNANFMANFRLKAEDNYSDFSVGVALMLLDHSFKLFTDLCKKTSLLNEEYNNLKERLNSLDFHPVLQLSDSFD